LSDSLHIVCPHCAAVNRIPEQRLNDAPNCGKCRKGLFAARPLELRADTFSKHIGRNDIPVVVGFWASWCGPCKMMAPAFEQAAAELEPGVRLAKLDTEAEQAIASRYAIRSIPTLVIFRNGQEVARQAGAMGGQDIVNWVRSNS